MLPSTKYDPRIVELGLHVRRVREGAGITTVDLAKRAGISRTSLYTLETGTGNPNLGTLLDVADALGVAVHTLIPRQRGGGGGAAVDAHLRRASS